MNDVIIHILFCQHLLVRGLKLSLRSSAVFLYPPKACRIYALRHY